MINRFRSALFSSVSNEEVETKLKISKPRKYDYTRPHFLGLNTTDEIQVSADHVVRPIIVPRESLPWNAGYAETINSGKSKMNEDQGRVHVGEIEYDGIKVSYYFFALFDGHAGTGAAITASNELHSIVHDSLKMLGSQLTAAERGKKTIDSRNEMNNNLSSFVTLDNLIVGALEASFHQMDSRIYHDNMAYSDVNGGTTCVAVLFINKKLYVANAGDSRAVLIRSSAKAPVPLSNDFTPETERNRIRSIALRQPSLLGNEFTANEYVRRVFRKDLGEVILYKAPYMTGWAYKIADESDLKFPLIFGNGKRSRVLATIGVTRGFGDWQLGVYNANDSTVKIKPFLSSQPEVKILDVSSVDDDDIVVMGTDGLWDVIPNELASEIVYKSLSVYSEPTDPKFKYRYVSAAQDLVMKARGKFEERDWRMFDGNSATIDDISVFVIPLQAYKEVSQTRQTLIEAEEEDDVEQFSVNGDHV